MKAYVFKNVFWGRILITVALVALLGLCPGSKECVRAADSGSGNTKGSITTRILQGKDDFATDIRMGLEGLVFYDSVTDMKVAVTSREDFTGSIRVIPVAEEYTDQKVAAYGEQITLAKDSTKEFSFTIKTVGTSGTFYLQLVDEKERVVYEERVMVNYANSDMQAMIGILSEDYSGLTYFDGLKIVKDGTATLTNAVELTEKTFPENEESLKNLQILLIDNYDTARLSGEQYLALKNWVRQGGLLILGLGPNYQNVLHCFTDEFLTGSFGELDKKEITWYEGATLPGVDVLSLQVDDAAELPVYETRGLAYRKTVGQGSVFLLGFDFAMEPMAGYENRKDAVQLLLDQAQVKSPNYVALDSYVVEEALGSIENGKTPSALLFLVVFVLYAVLGGPVLYLVLKKVKKSEKIWVAIPAAAVLFTGVVYLIGLTYRVSHPIVSAIAVIEMQGDISSESVYTKVTCPKRGKYDVALEEGIRSIQAMSSSYYDYSENSKKAGEYDFLMEQGTGGTTLKVQNQSPFDSNNFILKRTSESNFGEMALDIHCYTDGFDGSITNNTPYNWKDVMVVFENHICFVKEVKRGETVTIQKDMLTSAGYYGGAIEDFFAQKYGWERLYRERELYASYSIANFMNSYYMQKGDGQGMAWARLEGYLPEVSTDGDISTYGDGILCKEFSGAYEDVHGTYIKNIQDMAYDRQGECYNEEGNWCAYTDVLCSYYLDPSLGITRLTCQGDGQAGSGDKYWDPGMSAKIYALNPQTGDFDPIFEDSQELSGEELARYLADGVLTLKYDIDEDYGYGYLPVISARGEE